MLDPTTATVPSGESETTVPSTVIDPPGVSICEPMTKADVKFSVTTDGLIESSKYAVVSDRERHTTDCDFCVDWWMAISGTCTRICTWYCIRSCLPCLRP